MAYEEAVRSISLTSDATLAIRTGVTGTIGAPTDNAGNQYRAVKITGTHQVGLPTAVGDAVVGVLQNKPQVSGEAATVAIRGVSKVRVNGAIAAGATVYLAADGRGSATATGATALGVALTAAAGANELVPVLLRVN